MGGIDLPFSSARYKLTPEGVIVDTVDNRSIPKINNRVTLTCDGIELTLNVVIWMVVALFNIKIPSKHYSKINVRFKNGDPNDVSIDNLYYDFDEPIPCDGMPGYHYIPYYTRYAISRTGAMFDCLTKKTKKYAIVRPKDNDPKKRRFGYHVTTTVADRNHRGNLSKHRALALTYLWYKDDPFSLIVNHLDGDGGNNETSNLEWCTYSENTIHAYATGLQSNTLRCILIKETATGNVTEYASIIEASRVTGLGKHLISARVRRHEGVPFSDGYAIKYADSDVQWKTGPVIKTVNRSVPIACYNILDKTLVVCGNSVEAAQVTGVAQGTILKHIQVQSKFPWSGFLFRYFNSDMSPFPVYTAEQMALFRIPNRRATACGALVEDLMTGTKEVVLLSELAERFGKKRAYINKIVTEGKVFKERFKLKMVRPYL